MNQEQAKRHVCAVAAEEIRNLVDTGNTEFYEHLDSVDMMPAEDHPRITRAINELIGELERRGFEP